MMRRGRKGNDTLTFHYPNGKKYTPNITQANKNRSSFPAITHGKRGMTLEEDINESNKYYRATNQAIIHKKPTPIQVVSVDYPQRSSAKITEAYFKQPSTTDYNGIYRGKYIDFEAKETKNKTSIPLNNFHTHQVEHMQAVHEHGGISFLIVRFSTLQRTYLYDVTHFVPWFFQHQRKSIPLKAIESEGYLIPESYAPRLHYLQVVEDIYFHQ